MIDREARAAAREASRAVRVARAIADQDAMEARFAVGQVWKDRVRRPGTLCVIYRLYSRVYQDGTSALRASCTIVSSGDGHGGSVDDDDLDCRSIVAMYPHIMFTPMPAQEEIEQ